MQNNSSFFSAEFCIFLILILVSKSELRQQKSTRRFAIMVGHLDRGTNHTRMGASTWDSLYENFVFVKGK